MGNIVKYIHHGKKVSVDVMLKGKHRYHCLCWRCGKFKQSQRDENCPIASLLFAACRAFNIVTPVWECPNFIKGAPGSLHLEAIFSEAKEEQEKKHAD